MFIYTGHILCHYWKSGLLVYNGFRKYNMEGYIGQWTIGHFIYTHHQLKFRTKTNWALDYLDTFGYFAFRCWVELVE